MKPINRAKIFQGLKSQARAGTLGQTPQKKPIGAIGVPGVSGHHGNDITRKMIQNVNIIATAPQSRPHLYSPLAKRIYAVLSAAEKEELLIEKHSQEQRVLVELVNRLLDWDLAKRKSAPVGKLKVTPLQAKTLMKLYNSTTRRL